MENDPLMMMVILAAIIMVVGAVAAVTCARWPRIAVTVGYVSGATASALLTGAAIGLLFTPHTVRMSLGVAFGPVTAAYTVLLDPLAAFFLLLLGIGGLLSAPYAIGYARPAPDERGAASAWLAAGYNLFLLSMGLVILADNAFLFLLAWESMSLISYFLVSYHHERAAVRRAGLLYVIVTHVGAAFLLFAFALLAAADGGNLSFEAMRAAVHGGGLSPAIRNLAFLCALVGFGSKAGLMPMHFWLPRAHPAAPSHISAMMSGVMLKIALYGLIRMSFDLLGVSAPGAQIAAGRTVPPPLWWGALLLTLGLVSAILGALYAVVEPDLKRLLAFSSIENIGIISMSLGAALLCTGIPGRAAQALAALALIAACFHMLNHTVFKSLLFLVAGAVQHATRTTSLEALGGLVKRMPWTAVCALLGALAIAGLPPFNGFVSEWLTYQALLGVAFSSGTAWIRLVGVIAASGLALTAALAAATFLKAFGIGFLALPRSVAAEQAQEVAPSMRLSMAAGALLTVVLGIGAGGAFVALTPVIAVALSPAAAAALQPSLWMALPSAPSVAFGGAGSLAPLALVLPVALLPLGWGLARWIAGPARTRLAETWVCGQTLTPRMEYSATSFAKPLRRVFQAVLLPFREVRVTYASEPYVVERIEYRAGIASALDSALARSARRAGARAIEFVKAGQNGSIRLYLGYILATLILLLLIAR